jgi:hypothetical protein
MCALWVLWIWDVLDWHYDEEFTVMIILAVLGCSYEEVFSHKCFLLISSRFAFCHVNSLDSFSASKGDNPIFRSFVT